MTSFIVQDSIREEKFVLINKLGSGSFGSCYVSKKVGQDRLVAIKVMERQDMARKEARIMSTLFHPNIVKFNSFFVDQDRAYITMERATMSVAVLLRGRHHVSDPEARSFLRNIMYGLVYLKFKMIVHRDIKPGNLLVSSQRRIFICDFGVAVQMTSKDQVIKGYAGTRLYMPSEVHRNQEYSHPVDTYGVSLVLYELMRGKHAFDYGIPPVSFELVQRYIIEGRYDPLPFSCCPSGSDLVKQKLNPNPDMRITAEDALNSSFLQDFYIPPVLPWYITTDPPSYFAFTCENFYPACLHLHSICGKLEKVIEKVSVVAPGVAIGTCPFVDATNNLIANFLVFANRLLHTERGMGYHLTSGLVGFHFQQDSTAMIQGIVGQSIQVVHIDKELNGRVTRTEDATGTTFEKLQYFLFIQEHIMGASSYEEEQSESDVRIWKWYETQEKLVLCFSDGNV